MDYYIGCDVHKKYSVFAMVDERGHSDRPRRARAETI